MAGDHSDARGSMGLPQCSHGPSLGVKHRHILFATGSGIHTRLQLGTLDYPARRVERQTQPNDMHLDNERGMTKVCVRGDSSAEALNANNECMPHNRQVLRSDAHGVAPRAHKAEMRARLG